MKFKLLYIFYFIGIFSMHSQCTEENNNSNAVYPRINTNQVGQSFTASCSGYLESVEITNFGTAGFNFNGTLNIYNGQTGHNGTPIYSQAYSFTTNQSNSKIMITGNVQLTAGNQYTFIYSKYGLLRYEYHTSTAVYPGGKAYFNGTFGHNHDMEFEVVISNTTLSLNDFELSESDVVLYPNPTSTILNIDNDNIIEYSEVYDLLGKKVKTTKQTAIDVTDLSQGIYMLKVYGTNGSYATKKFVKQ